MKNSFLRILLFFLSAAALSAGEPVFQISGGVLKEYSWQNSESVFRIPEGVEQIDPMAFAQQWRNPVLKKLILPASVKMLPTAFWQGCLESLEAIEVSPANQYYCSMDGVLFSYDGRTLICYPPRRRADGYAVPFQVEKLSDWCFRDNPFLETISLPQELREIGIGAFYDCRSLRRLLIPGTVCIIGADAFRRRHDGFFYQILYSSQLFLANPANPYGPPADAAGTEVFLPEPLPAEHYQTRFSLGQPYLFTVFPGWNLYYIPQNHPVFFQKTIFSYLHSSYNQLKQCYITHSGSSPEGGLFWLFSRETQPVEFSGTDTAKLQIPENFGFSAGWLIRTYSQLQKEAPGTQDFFYWNPRMQKFLRGDRITALPAETPVWISLP